MAKNFTTPTGRLVWGDPNKAEPVMDDNTKQQKRDAAGQPIFEFAIGVAFAKNDPLWPGFRKGLKEEDRAAWPQFHDVNGEVLPGVKFADKITDGDGFNTKGVPHAQKDGYAGHYVVKFASRFAPTIHDWDGYKWAQSTNPGRLKCGDYIQVSGSTASNGSQQSPGMHRNLNMIAFIREGVAIVKGADPNETFGAPPPGTVAAPTMPTHPGAPPPAAPPAAPPAPPPAPPPVAIAAHPQSPIMLPAFSASQPGQTYDTMRSAGWSDDQLVAAGYMAAPVAPSTSYMTPPAAPPAPPPAPPAPPPVAAAPPPAPGPQMLPGFYAAHPGQTFETMIAAGWTPALLIQHGLMAG